MLKQVVLPAPLGPIRATISPSPTEKVTFWAARSPAKLFDSPSTSSSAGISRVRLVGRPGVEAERAAQRRPHAMGQRHHHHQQADAVEDLLGARHVDAEAEHALAQRLGEAGDQERADDRAEQGADAADDRPQDQLDRAADVEDLLGKQVVVVEGEEDAGERGHGGGEDDRVHLVAEDVDAERPRGLLVLADRLPVVAGAAAQEQMADEERHHRQRQHHVVEHARAAAQGPQVVLRVVGDRHEQPGGAADPAPVIEADAGELGEGDGEDREVDAGHAEAEREKADDGADERRRSPAPGAG